MPTKSKYSVYPCCGKGNFISERVIKDGLLSDNGSCCVCENSKSASANRTKERDERARFDAHHGSDERAA